MVLDKSRFDKIVEKYNDFKGLVNSPFIIDCDVNIQGNTVIMQFNDIVSFDDDDIQTIEYCMSNRIIKDIVNNIYTRVTDVYEAAKYPFINGVMQEIEDSGYDKEEMLEYLIDELHKLK